MAEPARSAESVADDRYSNWGDDWVERCDNLLAEKDNLEHDLGVRWGERNEALEALRALTAEYEKVVEIAQAAGMRSRYDQNPAYQRAKALAARYDGKVSED